MLEKERNRPLFLFSLSNSENDVSFMSCTRTCTLAWANFILLDVFSLFAFGNNHMVHCVDLHGHTVFPSVLHYLAKGAASRVRVPSIDYGTWRSRWPFEL